MSHIKTWKPLLISGAVLIINGIVFLSIMLSTDLGHYWGLVIGCLGAGLPLFVLGLLRGKKAMCKGEKPN